MTKTIGSLAAVAFGTLALLGIAVSIAPIPSAGAKSDIENMKVYKGKSIKDLVERSVDGAVAWKTLMNVFVRLEETDRGTLFIPEFNESVSVLDGKEIEIQGFMFPLEPTTDIPDAGDHFLLSSIPASCPYFHVYGGQIIDVIASERVEFDEDDPIRIRGRLALLHENRDGLFYRMTEVRLVQ